MVVVLGGAPFDAFQILVQARDKDHRFALGEVDRCAFVELSVSRCQTIVHLNSIAQHPPSGKVNRALCAVSCSSAELHVDRPARPS